MFSLNCCIYILQAVNVGRDMGMVSSLLGYRGKPVNVSAKGLVQAARVRLIAVRQGGKP